MTVSSTIGSAVVFAPGRTVSVLAFVLAGIMLGLVSGLVPGIHETNMAFLLAAIAPSLPGSPPLLGAAMLAAGVVHTFLDIVPMLALGSRIRRWPRVRFLVINSCSTVEAVRRFACPLLEAG